MKTKHHIIWHTFNTFPVWDKRGNGIKLKEFYHQLNELGIVIESDKAVPNQYFATKANENILKLDDNPKNFIKTEIGKMIKLDGDRVAGDLDTFGIFVSEDRIDLFIDETSEKVNQKIARIKSRIATLLSFEFPNDFKGENTWSKGIWIAKLTDNGTISKEEVLSRFHLIHGE